MLRSLGLVTLLPAPVGAHDLHRGSHLLGRSIERGECLPDCLLPSFLPPAHPRLPARHCYYFLFLLQPLAIIESIDRRDGCLQSNGPVLDTAAYL